MTIYSQACKILRDLYDSKDSEAIRTAYPNIRELQPRLSPHRAAMASIARMMTMREERINTIEYTIKGLQEEANILRAEQEHHDRIVDLWAQQVIDTVEASKVE